MKEEEPKNCIFLEHKTGGENQNNVIVHLIGEKRLTLFRSYITESEVIRIRNRAKHNDRRLYSENELTKYRPSFGFCVCLMLINFLSIVLLRGL